ncbi:hypothetical protein JJB07_14405 [Tumebacillus sp. ITR2]|uniref:Fibronectin type-III domain-containing protein n=1 Tax=Tumebacillus amylolyticus TaxID=2801339 RepID=A0ABS1JCR1_9BACL|nr:hypothetical protein [Tumebacillus amylolyticus]MBL0387829.1 hypothetical protein [Tumebacillus amylolyticus]
MAKQKHIRTKIKRSGIAILSALLLVSANIIVPLTASTAYAATGPVTLSGTAGNAQATLTWESVPNASGYDVYRNGTKLTSTPIPDTSYVDKTVINGTTYSYTVSAIVGGTSSAQSNPVSLLPKSTPGLLRRMATTTGVTNLTDGDNATYTSLPASTTQTFLLPTPAKVTGLNATSDNPYMQVKLYDTAGTVVGTYTPSNPPVNAFTALNLQHVAKVVVFNTNQYYPKNMLDLEITGLPDSEVSPTGLTANPGNAQVSFQWDSLAGVTEYNLYRNGMQTSNKVNTAPIAGTTFTDTNVINGNTYSYYLAPITATGEGVPSYVTALPKSPAGLLRGLASTTGVTNLTDGDNATYTPLPASGTETFLLPTPAKVTGLNATSDNPYMQVKLYDTAGTLVGTYTPSNPPINAFTSLSLQHVAKVVVVNTNQYYPKNMQDLNLLGTPDSEVSPTGLAANPGNAQVSFQWDSLSGVTEYNLYRNGVQSSNKVNSTPITGTTFTDTNVINGNTYTFYLAPITATGEGVPSYVTALPKSPAGLLRGHASTTGETNLTDGDNATYTSLPASGTQTFVLPAPAKVTGLNSTSDNPYLQVKLYDTTGTLLGTYNTSNPPVNAFTPLNFQNVAKVVVVNTNQFYSKNMNDLEITGTYQLTAPVGLTGQAGDEQATLTWTESQGAVSYNVYRDGVKINTAPVTSTTFTEAGLTNGTTYTYFITAVNEGGESGASNTISLTPQAADPNLLINPSFENGTASDTPGLQVGKNWTPYVPTGASPNLAVVTSPVYSGTYAQKISGSGIPNGSAIDIYQAVAAQGNTAYTVSGMYNIESLNNAFVQLYVDFYDADGHFIKSNSVKYGVTVPSYMMVTDNNAEPGYMLMVNNLTTSGYVQLTNSFTTPENTATFRLYAVLRASADNASGTFYVDDMSVIHN